MEGERAQGVTSLRDGVALAAERPAVLASRMRLPLLLLALSLATQDAWTQSSFPASWAGRWEGTLTTTTPPDSVRNRIPISLLIAREDTGSAWTWRTVFNADTVRGLRPYRLIPRDIRKGWFATDEGNGIELEETWVAGTLISIFQVGDRVLESRYAMHGDTLVHDITWWSSTPAGRARGSGANAEGGMEVLSYRVEGRQRATMLRVSAGTDR